MNLGRAFPFPILLSLLELRAKDRVGGNEGRQVEETAHLGEQGTKRPEIKQSDPG